MTETEARQWIRERYGEVGFDVASCFAALVLEEARRQNLIAPSTFDQMWSRHIVDSAQLIPLADTAPGMWLDFGSGAGFPGLVVAALSDRPVILVEPRKRRVDFLERAAVALDLTSRVQILCAKVERTAIRNVRVISARAVASLPELLADAVACADLTTTWLLPKGRSAAEEIAIARRDWHGTFHVERSVTDPDASIVVASGVAHR